MFTDVREMRWIIPEKHESCSVARVLLSSHFPDKRRQVD